MNQNKRWGATGFKFGPTAISSIHPLFIFHSLMIPVSYLQAQTIFKCRVILIQFLNNYISGSNQIDFFLILTKLISFNLLIKST
jgi:hypothetical protein